MMRPPARAMVWIVNPGPGPAVVTVGDVAHTLEAQRTLDLEVPSDVPLELTVWRAEASDASQQRATLSVEVGNQAREVTLVDLGADAAYAVMDASSYYRDGGLPEALPIAHLSDPAPIHHLPYAAATLVRPGRSLPARDSWDLHVFEDPDRVVKMFKVFRVTPARTADQSALAAVLTEGLISGNAADFENMGGPVRREAIVLGGVEEE